MNIKMLRDKRGHKAGDVIDLPDNMANVFIVQGIAEECDQPTKAKAKAKPKAKPEPEEESPTTEK